MNKRKTSLFFILLHCSGVSLIQPAEGDVELNNHSSCFVY